MPKRRKKTMDFVWQIKTFYGKKYLATFKGCETADQVRTWLNGGEGTSTSLGAFLSIGGRVIINKHYITEIRPYVRKGQKFGKTKWNMTFLATGLVLLAIGFWLGGHFPRNLVITAPGAFLIGWFGPKTIWEWKK